MRRRGSCLRYVNAASRSSGRGGRVDAHLVALLVLVLERDQAVRHGEQRVVRSAAQVLAWMELGPALPHQNVAGADELPAKPLHAQELRVRIAAVAAGAYAFLVSHELPLHFRDLDLGKPL